MVWLTERKVDSIETPLCKKEDVNPIPAGSACLQSHMLPDLFEIFLAAFRGEAKIQISIMLLLSCSYELF